MMFAFGKRLGSFLFLVGFENLVGLKKNQGLDFSYYSSDCFLLLNQGFQPTRILPQSKLSYYWCRFCFLLLDVSGKLSRVIRYEPVLPQQITGVPEELRLPGFKRNTSLNGIYLYLENTYAQILNVSYI